MKKEFTKSQVEIIVFDNKDDIVTQSGTVNPPVGPEGEDEF